MKVKVKFDTASLKRMALDHGEKVAFAIVLVVFVMFVYSGATREVLDATKQPDKLKSLASAVTAHVQNSSFSATREGFEITNYSDRTTRTQIVATEYALPEPFNPPLFDEKVKREDPHYFNAEELRAGGGYGTFAMASSDTDRKAAAAKRPAANENVKQGAGPREAERQFASGKRPTGHGFKPRPNSVLKSQAWAVVTGLIPVEKQATEYARVFDGAQAYDAVRDKPLYVGYQLERAEISSTEPDKLAWKTVGQSHFQDGFETTADEIVPPEFVGRLTSKLGPLVGKDWGEAVAHPKVPLVWAKPSQQTAKAADEAKEKQTAATEVKEKPEEVGAFVVVNSSSPPKSAAKEAVPSNDKPAPAPFRLLRVFDYTVERGNRYRYRIKLLLANPNYNVPARYLKNPDKRPKDLQGEYVVTPEWSEPTEIVTIPNGSDVLAGGVKGGSRPDLVRAKVLLTSIDPETGIEASVEKDLERGALANALETDVKARDPRGQSTIDIAKVRFQSDMVVLDIYGGRTLGRRGSTLVSPGDVLLLDAKGNLTVHSELDDLADYESAKPPEEEQDRSDEKEKPPGSEPRRSKRVADARSKEQIHWITRAILARARGPRLYNRLGVRAECAPRPKLRLSRAGPRTSSLFLCGAINAGMPVGDQPLSSEPHLLAVRAHDFSRLVRQGSAIGTGGALAGRSGEPSGLDRDSAGRYLSRSHL